MNSPGAGRSSHPHWRKLYEAAVLELDAEKLPSRIEKAKKAIHKQLVEIASSEWNSHYEPLMDALNVLDDLLRMDLARREELKRKAEH